MKIPKILLTTLALAAATAALSAADATENWTAKGCKACHGDDGKGQTPMGKKLNLKDFTDAKFQATFTDDQAFKAIKEGIKDGDKTVMKAAEDVTDADIKALVAKVRAFKK
jgi:cytochrome c551/c552